MVLPQASTGPGPRLIQEGDLVVVYESYNAIKAVYVDKKGQYANRFGNFQHKVRKLSARAAAAAQQQQPLLAAANIAAARTQRNRKKQHNLCHNMHAQLFCL
jgi:hypothetical protein